VGFYTGPDFSGPVFQLYLNFVLGGPGGFCGDRLLPVLFQQGGAIFQSFTDSPVQFLYEVFIVVDIVAAVDGRERVGVGDAFE
jgi:hypothetical protein